MHLLTKETAALKIDELAAFAAMVWPAPVEGEAVQFVAAKPFEIKDDGCEPIIVDEAPHVALDSPTPAPSLPDAAKS